MAKPLLAEKLWERIQPILPPEPPKPKGGRPRVSDRKALMGIIFVVRTGCPWEYLPQELGCGSGMTCWRRLRDWHAAGVWEKVWRLLLDEMGLADEIDWSKVAFDSCSVRALFGGYIPARTPPIAVKMARSGMLSAMARGRRWRSRTQARTSTIPSKRSR
jgi:transposase